MSRQSNPMTIGIVACSSEGAALCYRTICSQAPKFMGPHAHPSIALHGISLSAYVDALESGDLNNVAEIMIHSARNAEAAGADFLICPDNTVHSAMHIVNQNSPLPWLNIAHVVTATAKVSGFKKVAILGTKWLVESEVYPEALSTAGIEYMRPESEERNEISRIIMDELVNDIQNESSIIYFQNLIHKMKDRGCDAVVLGCTEIPIIINDNNSALPTLDSTRLLAEAALKLSITGRS